MGEQERPISPEAQQTEEQVQNRDPEAGAAEDLSPGGADVTDVDGRSADDGMQKGTPTNDGEE